MPPSIDREQQTSPQGQRKGKGVKSEVSDCIVRMIGVWLLSDSIYSLILYIPQKGQSWLKDHSIRIVRLVLAIMLMFYRGGVIC